jgi:two-component system heavy metal sensor histidine kinase CusS
MFSKNVQNKTQHPTRRWSISRRLTLFYVLTTTVLLVLAAAYLYWSQVKNLEREDNDFIATKIQDCREVLQNHPNDAHLLVNEIQIEAASSLIKYYIRLLDDRGHILMETPGMTNSLPVASFPAAGTNEIPNPQIIWKTATGRECLLMSALVSAKGTETPRILQAALDVSEEEELMAGYRRKLLMVVILGSVFSWIVGALVTRKGLQPLTDIANATERISASQLHERIIASGWPKELEALAGSFDRMLDRLEDSFKRLSQFSADLAHELRTPINNLRGEAGVALSQSRTPEEYRRTLESSLEEYARLTRLIDNLLFLARADGATVAINRSRFDAMQAVEIVREYYEALAEDRGVQVRCEGEGEVNADPVLFRQAVSNLLSNALNYTPRGGEILIHTGQHDGHGLEVHVSDTGPGIPQEQLPRIFERLYRADPARSQHPNGAGLGLAIVKSIMALHGGSVEVQSELGTGAKFTLVFPTDLTKLTKM